MSSKWTASGAALVLSVTTALLAGSAGPASAAQSRSPFEGTYLGSVPHTASGTWSLKISQHGRVLGSYSRQYIDDSGHKTRVRGSLTGTISDAGVLSSAVTLSWDGHWVYGLWGYDGLVYVAAGSMDFVFTATASIVEEGLLLHTSDSFVPTVSWFRQS